MINGTYKWSIQASRDLRQGHPLSPPFLFLVIGDGLSKIILKGVEGNIIEAFKVGANEVTLTHLQFVDDTMFFCSRNEVSFLILNLMVGFFEVMFGLKINRSKCQILGIKCH